MGQVPEPGRFAHGSLWLFPAPQKASEGQDHELDSRQKADAVGDTHHVNARHLLYPNSHVTRFPVPNEKVPWDVSASLGRRHLGFWGAVLPRALRHSWAPGRLAQGSPPPGMCWMEAVELGSDPHGEQTVPLPPATSLLLDPGISGEQLLPLL